MFQRLYFSPQHYLLSKPAASLLLIWGYIHLGSAKPKDEHHTSFWSKNSTWRIGKKIWLKAALICFRVEYKFCFGFLKIKLNFNEICFWLLLQAMPVWCMSQHTSGAVLPREKLKITVLDGLHRDASFHVWQLSDSFSGLPGPLNRKAKANPVKTPQIG